MTRTLVKLPTCAQRTVLAFPFIKLLLQEQGKREVFFIADQGNAILLDAFEGGIIHHKTVFELPLNKRSLLGAHHYAMNLHDIFNIDEYFDLESSLASTSLGVTFKARTRLGFERSLAQKIFYHKRVLWNNDLGSDSNYVRLLSEGLGLSDRAAYLENIRGSEVVPLTKYLFVALKGLYDSATRDLYAHFLNGFDHTAYIFWELDGDLSASFYELLHPKLQYKIIKTTDFGDVENIAKTAVGIVTNQSWMAWLGSYWALQTVCLNEKLERSQYFDLNPQSIPLMDDNTDEALSFVHNYLGL